MSKGFLWLIRHTFGNMVKISNVKCGHNANIVTYYETRRAPSAGQAPCQAQQDPQLFTLKSTRVCTAVYLMDFWNFKTNDWYTCDKYLWPELQPIPGSKLKDRDLSFWWVKHSWYLESINWFRLGLSSNTFAKNTDSALGHLTFNDINSGILEWCWFTLELSSWNVYWFNCNLWPWLLIFPKPMNLSLCWVTSDTVKFGKIFVQIKFLIDIETFYIQKQIVNNRDLWPWPLAFSTQNQ